MTSSIKKISEARFRALTFAILPMAFILYEEVEWYSDEKEYFIASLIYDRADEDWCYVIITDVRKFFPGGVRTFEQNKSRVHELIYCYKNKGLPTFIMFSQETKEFVGRFNDA